MITKSYILGVSILAIPFAINTDINTGMTCVIWDVISNNITHTDIVWVTAPPNAAAPTVAYAPGMICVIFPLYLTPKNIEYVIRKKHMGYSSLPRGNQRCISSPAILPRAAPALNTGMKLPQGIGMEDAIIENINWKKLMIYKLFILRIHKKLYNFSNWSFRRFFIACRYMGGECFET